MVKWTDEKVLALVKKAREAGRNAEDAKLRELCETYHTTPRENHPVYGDCPRFLGCCGGSWVVINARQGFYRVAKRLSSNRGLRFHCSKAYGGGGMFSVYDMSNRQELVINEACSKAVKDVLDEAGVKTEYIHTYID